MIERENSGATLTKVEVNAKGGTLSIKSSHLDSLILAVEAAKNTGWNRISGADVFDGKVSLILIKSEGSVVDLPTLRGAIRRQDTDLIMACNSEELVSYFEGEYVPEVVNDIPPPELIKEEEEEEIVGEELKPKEKPVKKAYKKKTTTKEE